MSKGHFLQARPRRRGWHVSPCSCSGSVNCIVIPIHRQGDWGTDMSLVHEIWAEKEKIPRSTGDRGRGWGDFRLWIRVRNICGALLTSVCSQTTQRIWFQWGTGGWGPLRNRLDTTFSEKGQTKRSPWAASCVQCLENTSEMVFPSQNLLLRIRHCARYLESSLGGQHHVWLLPRVWGGVAGWGLWRCNMAPNPCFVGSREMSPGRLRHHSGLGVASVVSMVTLHQPSSCDSQIFPALWLNGQAQVVPRSLPFTVELESGPILTSLSMKRTLTPWDPARGQVFMAFLSFLCWQKRSLEDSETAGGGNGLNVNKQLFFFLFNK